MIGTNFGMLTSHVIRNSHTVSILIYDFLCAAKYRRTVIDEKVQQVLKEVCLKIDARHQVEFLEIGTDKDHVHFLVQSVPTYSPTRIITVIKSPTAREYLPQRHWSRSNCGEANFGRMAIMQIA